MSDESDKWLALYDEYHSLFLKAIVQAISPAEEAELKAALDQLQSLAPYLDCRVEVFDPRESAAREAAEVYEMHYRQKIELDRKLYGAGKPISD